MKSPISHPSCRHGAIAFLLAGALTLTACGGEKAQTVKKEARFITACQGVTNMPDAVCECLGEKAAEELSDPSFDLLVASLEEDFETAKEIRATISIQDAMQTGLFMVNRSPECGAGNME